jgi:hypothetical protein
MIRRRHDFTNLAREWPVRAVVCNPAKKLCVTTKASSAYAAIKSANCLRA